MENIEEKEEESSSLLKPRSLEWKKMEADTLIQETSPLPQCETKLKWGSDWIECI